MMRRRTPYRFVLAFALAGAAASSTVHAEVAIKATPGGAGGYFDPHTHWSGILPYRVYTMLTADGMAIVEARIQAMAPELRRELAAAAEAEWGASECEGGDAEARRACFAGLAIEGYLAHHHLGTEALSSKERKTSPHAQAYAELDALETALVDRFQPVMAGWLKDLAGQPDSNSSKQRVLMGSNTLFAINDACAKEIAAAAPGAAKVKLEKHMLQDTMTATPQLDFDSAYVARGAHKDNVLVNSKELERRLNEATIRELKRQQIVYSEQSIPLKWDDTAKAFKPLAYTVGEISDAARRRGIEVKWLAMLLTGQLADDGNGQQLAIGPGGACGARGDQAPDNSKYLLAALADPNVVGFDVAGPERTCFTPVGGCYLERLIEIAYQAAVKYRRHLVAHVHVGEGYPYFDPSRPQKVSCMPPKNLEPAAIDVAPGVRMPPHYQQAMTNIDRVLDAVAAVRARHPDLGERIEVRLGHATHAKEAQAKRMKEMGVWADVNLTSNLATGALRPDLEAGADMGDDPRINLKTLATNPKSWVYFKAHAIFPLLAAGVKVVLGTDGGGVEHSTMEGEYQLAEAVLANGRERAAGPAGGGVEELLRNQAEHYGFMHAVK